MDAINIFLDIFLAGAQSITLGNLVMFAIGGVLIFLAIKKEYEPMLLLPIGFGAILVNLPFSTVWGTFEAVGEVTKFQPSLFNQPISVLMGFAPIAAEVADEPKSGFLKTLYNAGIITELFPILIFIGVGAMIDFSQLMKMPKMLFFGAAAQFGIFMTLLAALVIGHFFPSFGIDLNAAASIAIVGAADGPTAIFVAEKLSPAFLAPISVAAYSYMSLVPIIQPPVIKALTTKEERLIRMDYKEKKVSKAALIMFPIVVTVVAGIIAPESVALVGALMFGNLIRECGVLERLSATAQNELVNLVTLLLGITIGSTMHADAFLKASTLLIMGLGLFAFVFDTAGGVLFAKFINLFSKEKVNPMIGAAGISAFPMSSRIIQKMAKDEDPSNFILMQAVSANVSGQLGSVIAGGIILHTIATLFM